LGARGYEEAFEIRDTFGIAPKVSKRSSPSKNFLALSFYCLVFGLLARLFVFQINFFSMIFSYSVLFSSEIVIGAVGQF
jgi:hypothetical protein